MNQKLTKSLQQNKLWAVIPAAGSGSRFSKSELKQYQIILEKTVLEHTVERINVLPLTGYVLAIGIQDNIAKNITLSHKEKAHFCFGGQERVHSVLNSLNYLLEIASEDDWVFVHDAARPCVSEACLINLVDTAISQNTNAILAIPVRDTLKRVVDGSGIEKTVSRNFLWQAQTPQIARLGTLKTAIEKALKDNIVVTDEASALEYLGQHVQVVQGRADNIKITYPDDLVLASLILQSQK